MCIVKHVHYLGCMALTVLSEHF